MDKQLPEWALYLIRELEEEEKIEAADKARRKESVQNGIESAA